MTESFIVTKEHRRFTEFADAVKKQRTIGICFGPAGVGKTLSARRYAHWDSIGPFIDWWGFRDDSDEKIYAAANRTRTVFYTPHVATTQKTLEQELNGIIIRAERGVEEHLTSRGQVFDHTGRTPWAHFIELIIIDEAERLSANALEHLRDQYDRTNVALILIGMPGIEKQFSHYPQALQPPRLRPPIPPSRPRRTPIRPRPSLAKTWQTFNLDDFTDAQAFAAIERTTRGNFRLLERLFPQIERVLKINDLDVITNDVIEAARSTLVIGTT